MQNNGKISTWLLLFDIETPLFPKRTVVGVNMLRKISCIVYALSWLIRELTVELCSVIFM